MSRGGLSIVVYDPQSTARVYRTPIPCKCRLPRGVGTVRKGQLYRRLVCPRVLKAGFYPVEVAGWA